MEPTVQAKIINISTNHANPTWAAGQMSEVIKDNVKLVSRTTQKLLLLELVRKKIPLKDVRNIEIKQRWNKKSRKDLSLIEFLMRKKLRSAQDEEKRQRKEYWKVKAKLYGGKDDDSLPAGWRFRINRKSAIASKFRCLQKEVVSKVFKQNLESNARKVKHLKESKEHDDRNTEVGDIINGVKVGDKELEENEEKPANVWGNTKVSEEAKEVLNLGKKFRLHTKLDSIAAKTEIEKGLTIIRWKEKEDEETEAVDNLAENEEIYNIAGKVVDLSMMKATDMKFNRRIFAPNAAKEKLESNLQQTREALENVFEKYKSEKADKKGVLRETNLTEGQTKGLKQLKEKTKGESVVMPTDKTMGLSIESKESYKAAAAVHIVEDEIVTEKVRKKVEAEFNATGKAMIRFLGVGGARKADDRIKEAMLTENVMLPPLSLYGKDHKPEIDPVQGPKRRPVVSANEGPNARVSELAAIVLNKAADAEEAESECKSTEALQAKVEEFNKRLVEEARAAQGLETQAARGLDVQRKVVLGSLDFKAWYPSMKVEVVVPVIRKRLEASPAVIKVCDLELSRFLYVMMEDEEIAAQGLDELLHTQKDPSEKKPRLTDQEMIGGEDFRTGAKSKLKPPVRTPTEKERKTMTAIAMSLIVQKVMTNFLYSFGGDDRKQASGGPIGDVLTQAIARHMGNEFDDLFKGKMAKLGIENEIYQRYADDIDLAHRTMGVRTKFCPMAGKLVPKTEEEIESEAEKEEDELTMIELKKVADSLMPNIETEYDCPSLHPELEKKVPVLDLAMWVEEVRVSARGLDGQELHTKCSEGGTCLPLGESARGLDDEEGHRGGLGRGGLGRGVGGPNGHGELERGLGDTHGPASWLAQQIQFEFYSKPMAPSKVILASSAQPWGQKRTTLTQELIRRMLNCKKELSCELKQKHLNKYMQMLKNSGYDVKFRSEILESGLAGYRKILTADRSGQRPLYRPTEWCSAARRLDKLRKKKNWLGKFWKSCIFVPPTPGSELKKSMQKKEEETRAGGREAWPIKIIETAGKTLEQTLVNTDPFNGNTCNDQKCLVNSSSETKISCRRNGVCYRVTCLRCPRAGEAGREAPSCPRAGGADNLSTCYHGESGKNMHCRLKEHVSKFNSKSVKTQSESAFIKHLESTHGGKEEGKVFTDYFEVEILKSYRKAFTRCVEEGTYIASHQGESLNSKSEWHQPKVIRTTTRVVQGGAEVVQRGAVVDREQGGGKQGGEQQGGGRQERGGEQQEPRAQRGRAGRARGQ